MRKLWLPLYLLGTCLVLPVSARINREQLSAGDRPKRLIVVLDGVPYHTIAELREEGGFRSFHAPARMVATFPSLTNPSMIEILGVENSPGYEDHYYDREHDRLVGGFQDRVRGGSFIKGTFRQLFNYHAPALRGSLAYIAQPIGAIIVAQADVAAFQRSFRQSHEPLFVAYIGATDSLAHLGGERPLKSLLRSLDRSIETLRAESVEGLSVEILSDHGNLYGEQRFVKLNAAIEGSDFSIEKSLAKPGAVILPRYGLVGSAVLFTRPENRKKLAEVSAATTGVDFAVYQQPGEEGRAMTLVSRRGQARIERQGTGFRYRDLGGDPLELNGVISLMESEGRMDQDGSASLDDWWQATREHRYPDALRRLFDGFTEHVRTPGDVLVSFEDGYLIGSPFFGAFARMRATHGNLLSAETEGFAMSTRIELGPAVRGRDVRRLFGLDEMRRAGQYLSTEGHCVQGLAMAQSFARTTPREN
ncbi:MAG: hypothetical protein ABI882_09330 [Acidobacteriota bacterium]